MEKIIDLMNGLPWNLIVPLTMSVVGIVLFVVIYSKENKRINKHRKDIQQQIVNEEFAKKLANKYKGNEVNNH